MGRQKGLGIRAALSAGEKVPSASFPEGRLGPARGSLPGGLAWIRRARGAPQGSLSLLGDSTGDYVLSGDERGTSPKPSNHVSIRI